MSNLSLNKAILGGRLTETPELKQTPQGVFVTTFRIAINRRGDQNEADFISCVAWRQTAEFICRYFGKGSGICIVGRIQTRSWEDSKKNKRYATEVIADEAYFVDGKGEEAEAAETVHNTPPIGLQENLEDLFSDDDLPF